MVEVMLSGAKRQFGHWLADESGNVTVEWVAVVAGAVAFSIIALASISGGTEDLAADMGTELSTRALSTY